ncbi:substrate-binding periplasmic protein [Marinobacter sp. JSM 1782161]|uniref:substrate-binding periplasmic protein n=1 Tax=Marinobacter sp. JSM 1782161 TaxID=2685906 RepID=UPI0014021E11|nr:transporter substrate-binding domain-containing protein [Marinobacter sp. JSM 1782161]
MPRRTRGALRTLLAAGLLLGALSPVTRAETVRLTNGDWPPFLIEEPPHGLVSQVVERAFALEGVDVEWGFFPWSRSFKLARDGNWDGSAGWSCSPEREINFYFSDPIAPIHYVFFHRADRTFEWDTIHDLKGLRIGLTQDYNYGRALARADAEGLITTDVTTSDRVNFRKLLAGRIDLFPIDIEVGRHMLREQFSEEEARRLTYHPHVLHAAQLHLILSRLVPGNRALINRFNHGLHHLQASGEMREIAEQSGFDTTDAPLLLRHTHRLSGCADSRDTASHH